MMTQVLYTRDSRISGIVETSLNGRIVSLEVKFDAGSYGVCGIEEDYISADNIEIIKISTSGCSHYEACFIKFCVDGLWGLADAINCEILLENKYDDIKMIYEDCAEVLRNGKTRYANWGKDDEWLGEADTEKLLYLYGRLSCDDIVYGDNIEKFNTEIANIYTSVANFYRIEFGRTVEVNSKSDLRGLISEEIPEAQREAVENFFETYVEGTHNEPYSYQSYSYREMFSELNDSDIDLAKVNTIFIKLETLFNKLNKKVEFNSVEEFRAFIQCEENAEFFISNWDDMMDILYD